ncbi:MAG: hypothetical protein H6712_22825 [Myxococcales bacterium]|nr:hypothetical protein [Myxococcales bacterium]
MERAAAAFVGTHDFAGFRASACQAASTERTIEAVTITGAASPLGPAHDPGRLDPLAPSEGAGPDLVDVDVRGRAFLYNMVRIMVGTLVEVGLRRRTPESIAELLAQPDRRQAGPTAPPRASHLVEVRWPPPNGLGAGDGAATAE